MAEIIAALYEIARPLGSGGGGVVYLGRHLRLEKDVALKADKRELSEKTRASLRREVETLKNLSHTYIPQVYDFVSEGGTVYTVMDYIDGESLDNPLKRGERFASPQVVAWATQALEALVYLHSRPPYGILHSDIKPANIMLTPSGDIKLIDFNIALALGEDGAVSVGRSLGYASPEHYGLDYSGGASTLKTPDADAAAKITTVSDTETLAADISETAPLPTVGGQTPTPPPMGGTKKTIVLDARSDIYGLGATLYHLITGRRPTRRATDVAPLTAKDCPIGLALIINKAMTPDKNLRYQTAADMLAAFTNIRKNDPRARRSRRIRNITAASLTVFLAVGSFTAFTGLKRMEAEKSMLSYAEASQNALTKGDISGAVALAALSAPTKSDIFTPPASAKTRKALADALGVYDLSDGFKPYRTLSLPSAPLMADASPDGKLAAVVYAYETAVIDFESGEIIATLPMMESALAEARFLNDSTVVYAGRGGIAAYDARAGRELWRDLPATAAAVAAGGGFVAAVNRDAGFATVYGADGGETATIDFDGRKQRVAANDAFANPRDNLFALSADGRWLAVSFDDGSLSVFDVQDKENRVDIMPESDHTHFEGGFSGDLLAFSATDAQSSAFAVVDIVNLEQLGGFEAEGRFGVAADESGVFVSSDNLVVRLDPFSGEQQELAWADADVSAFAAGKEYTLAALDGNDCVFFDGDGRLISRHKRDFSSDITLVAGDFALLGGRDATDATIFRSEKHEDAQIFAYDPEYIHDEARLSADGSRATLFSTDGFRLYDGGGALIREQTIPNAGRIDDQQYGKASGNLAVMWKDALTIYSGRDGEPLFEETGLRSVFYAPYGVSALDANGRLRLIDPDSGEVAYTAEAGGNFAAYCGMLVDDAFLDGRKLIGAAKVGGGYRFAASDGVNAAVYDESGKRLFEIPVSGDAEAFFTETAVIISPVHGTPAAYGLKNGGKLADLEKDAYLTYIAPFDGGIAAQYISSDGERFGELLDEAFRPVASLPNLCDISGGRLIFDYPQGILRHSRVYSINELLDLAKGGPTDR
jgi:serine/threonine protein kinase/outer membrane protein assembly factor BamB